MDHKGKTMIYSIGTLVTDLAQYQLMRSSFEQHGFDAIDCEYLQIDNTRSNQKDAYAGLNQLLTEARGQYIILCHQDVRMIDDGRKDLDAALIGLETLDPHWALAGNAGGIGPGRLALRITDPHGTSTRRGALPARVYTLDENFIVVKRSARIGFSRDLVGFHFYGADICMAADVLGYSAYVINFHLQHLSPGVTSSDFFAARSAFHQKWSRALRSRRLQTTCATVPVAGTYLGRLIGSCALLVRQAADFARARVTGRTDS